MSENYEEKQVVDTLKENYLPYAVSVIVSRAIPEIDGFKPSHRKLLYTMYKKGLLGGKTTKSANIVGETMKLNPHGDAAIYETMVRLTRGHAALLHPLVESKGNFGNHYSRDTAYAAARYTEAKLDDICKYIFTDIEKDVVDFVPNYDGEMTEPVLLPTAFPNVLVNPNQGIAVGMASSICSFNLREVCDTTIALIKDPNADLMTTLVAPDFPTGGDLVYDAEQLRRIYDTGVGSFKVRAKYNYEKKGNTIEVYEIPYSTTIEAIIDKVVDLVESSKLREINNIRDLSDMSGLRISIELKKGVDPDKLMQKLYKMTPLEDSTACNFNILIAGSPRVMGVREILTEWIAFRTECIKRGLFFDLTKKKDRYHLLTGLQKILLDIDKAIKIVRETEDDDEVVPNLMIGFGIDKPQAEFVADIKLRNLNKEYILNKTSELEKLASEIADIEDILAKPARVKKIIVQQLTEIAKKEGKPRKTKLLYLDEISDEAVSEDIPDYPVTVFVTREGYFKKVTALSLRMSGEQKFKEGDGLSQSVETTNAAEMLVFTDMHQCYKSRVCDFADTKISVLGDYLPQALKMQDGEKVVYVAFTTDYKGNILSFFRNGKCSNVDLASFVTKLNRKKLVNAYSDASELVAMFCVTENTDFVLTASNSRTLIVNSGMISVKTTKNTSGVHTMTLKAKTVLASVKPLEEGMFTDPDHYRTKNIPAAGSFLRDADNKGQTTLI